MPKKDMKDVKKAKKDKETLSKAKGGRTYEPTHWL